MIVYTILVILFHLLLTSNGRRIHPKKSTDAWESSQHQKQHSFKRTTTQLKLPTRESHVVTSLPLQPKSFKTNHYAGHIPTNSNERQFFYWLFEPAENGVNHDDAPLLVWLNGGPGCTSLIGTFIENGPFAFKRDVGGKWSLEENPHSWHKLAYMLYIDQPVGTGLSFTTTNEYCTNDQEVNEDLYAFMQNFLQVHRKVFVDGNDMNRKLWFSGESYAGHYIPSFMNYVLDKGSDGDGIRIDLGGAAIGNGWTDPYHQYSSSMASYSKGIIDLSQWAYLNSKEQLCQSELAKGKFNVDVCYTLLDEVINSSCGESSSDNCKVSFYDTRILDENRYPTNIDVLEAFMGNDGSNRDISPSFEDGLGKRVLEAVHAANPALEDLGQVYKDCTDPPFYALQGLDGKGAVQEVANILNHKNNIPILFFNGIDDLVCNHVGNEIFLNKLNWNYSTTWSTAQRYAWKISSSTTNWNNPIVGYIKSHHNLSFLKIKDAGHMAAMDQPEVSFEMMRIFLNEGIKGFEKHMQGIGQADPVDFGTCKKDDLEVSSARRKQLKTMRRTNPNSNNWI